jgi:type I restriction enzyme S subunit
VLGGGFAMKYSAYPVYKDSGVEWLGEIPENWHPMRIKYLTSILRGKFTHRPRNDPRLYNGTYPFIQTGDVAAADKYIKSYEQTLNELGFSVSKQFPKGTLVMAIAANIGDLAILDFPACFPDSIVGFLPKAGIDLNYLYFNLTAMKSELIGTAIQNTQLNLNVDRIGSLFSVSPPQSEQQAIASFLDRETVKIDALIAKKERLIELLQEKRTAIISHAVTKGLDPSVALKDSGVNLYPSVPMHWTILRLRYLCKKVADGPHFSPAYVEEGEGIMFLSARNVKVDGWSLDDAKYVSEEDYREFCKRIVPEVGDILYTKGGTTGIARVVDLTVSFQVWVHIAVLKLKQEKVNPYFLAYVLNSAACYGQSQLYTRGATNNDLGLTRLINIVLAIPPKAEQEQIVTYLDRETAKIDALIAKIREGIEKLKEYRTALISAAVTGKIDVRNEVAS